MGKQQNEDDGRRRSWATIVYQESAPDGWRELLSDCHLKGFISPLHDKDIYTDLDVLKAKKKLSKSFEDGKITKEDYEAKLESLPKAGDPKKPHWHVMVMFDGKKSGKQMKPIFESFGGVGVEGINDKKSYARYLCHLDEGGQKSLYNTDDVEAFGGADYATEAQSKIDRIATLTDVFRYIKNSGIKFFDDLIDEYIECGMTDYLEITLKYSYVISSYLRSKSQKAWFTMERENKEETIRAIYEARSYREKDER